MKVMVTEKGSPAKYADWEGVMATRMPASGSEVTRFGIVDAWSTEAVEKYSFVSTLGLCPP